MLIIHIEDYFDPTAGYQINELIKINTSGVQQIVITSTDMSPFHKKYSIEDDNIIEEKFNIKIIRLDVIFKFSSRVILKGLWKTIDELKPDIIFLHGIGDFKDLVLFRKQPRYKIVRDCHMSWVASKNPFAKFFIKFYSIFFSPIINSSRKYNKIFALGIEEYQYLKALRIKDNKIEMLPHGYNREYFYFDKFGRDNIRKRLNVDEDCILIAYIGKLNEFKRPDIIFNIITNDLLKKHKIKLLFVGPKDIKYMQEIFMPKLENNNYKEISIIENSKKFEELRLWYSASDICIWPKQTTLSSIHAQVCGATVIMENQISNKERVIKKENLYKKNNIQNASEILRRIIEQKEYVRKEKIDIDERLRNREYNNQFNTLLSLLKDNRD